MRTIRYAPVIIAHWEWYEEPYDSLLSPDGNYGWRCSHCKTDLEDYLTHNMIRKTMSGIILDDYEDPPLLNHCPCCGAKMTDKNIKNLFQIDLIDLEEK